MGRPAPLKTRPSISGDRASSMGCPVKRVLVLSRDEAPGAFEHLDDGPFPLDLDDAARARFAVFPA